ncbi:alpha-2-macroglobulin family protein [Massilia sp. S19_KUP03_FR1]|uniref:alpha-2-macroglobulin family protein n=1 Tax=Massilia sp. S19_KUP03_FR1 TaxID=3025503 RepID=UPI002FCD8254
MSPFAKKAVIALTIVTLAVAGAATWKMKKTRDERAPTGAAILPAASSVFAISSCTSKLHDDRPALALMFTDSVDASQALDKLIVVRDQGIPDDKDPVKAAPAEKPVAGGWIVGSNPRQLLFPFVKPGHAYSINVGAALAAASGGRTLPQAHTCEVKSDAMTPSYFFASKGTVLPAGLNGGLPVVTINIPEVDVEFLRVAPEKLPAFVDFVTGKRRNTDSDDNDEGEDYYDGSRNKLKGQTYPYQLNALKNMSTSVYANRFLTSAVADSRKTSFLPVEKIAELKEPGIYVAVMRRPGHFDEQYQVTYFYVSDIGLHARRQAKFTDVFTTSLGSGKALGGIDIDVVGAAGKVLMKGKTDSDGHAALTGLPDAARLLLAWRGKETSIIALQEPGLDLAEFDIGGHLPRDVKLFAWSGRDLYRPGEKFTLSVLVRGPDGQPLPPMPVKAELKKPSGDVVSSSVWQPDAKRPGYLQQTISLPLDADTGRWSMELRADPSAKRADAIVSFQVEEFLPERMKLTLTTDDKPLAKDDAFSIAVQGDYLYGAPAAGNRLLGSASQERARNPLPKAWPGFIFGDYADDSTAKKRAELPETALDEAGKASIDVPFDTMATSPMRVRAALSLLESGGRPVVRSIERIWWPAAAMIAVRPAFERDVAREGSMAEFELIRVTPAGVFAPLKQAQFSLVREDREYYWRYDAERGWHSGYSEDAEIVQSGAVELKARTKLTLPVAYGTYRLEITDPDTKIITRYRFYAGWNAQDAESVGNRPDRVRLQLEGAPATAGGEVTLKINPPHDGEALVLVEADKVLWSKRVSVSTGGTSVTIPIDKTWNRSDMYISTVVFRPGSQGDRVTPARAVGMAWLPMARQTRQLKVSVTAPAQVEPEKRTVAKIKVDNAGGKKVMVTLSAVDVGILNITSFATPDPFDFFFGKHRFGPELTDIYGKLIERMDGTVGTLKWGGDAGKRDTKSMPKKVKLVDLFSGPVQLDAKGEANIALDIPDFNGNLRLMVVAASDDAYGKADREMLVSAPIVAEIAMPRFIGPGDSAAVALDVTNMMKTEQEVSIKLGTDKLLKLPDGARTLKLAPRQRSILRFNVEATEPYGLSRITLDVRTGGAKPVVIHREFALQVQPPVPRERDARRIRIEPGASATLDAKMVERFHLGSATLNVTLSNKPPLNVRSIVKGLLDYPYGCLEQTTSAAYPHVFIDEAGARAVGLEPRTREQRARFIEGAISRIAGMQGSAGGFRLWRGDDGAYENWLTPYVTSFLLDAREAGFNVPEEMTKRAQTWMVERLNDAPNQFPALPALPTANAAGLVDWRDFFASYDAARKGHQHFAELSHIGYMLAREQKASLASLRLLHDKYRNRARSPLPLVQLGVALALMGDAKRSAEAIDEAMKKPYGLRSDWEWEYLGDYGSGVRDQAMAYALLVRHKIEHPRRETMLLDLADRLSKPRYYYSTQERIALFLAARAAGGSASEPWKAVLNVGKDAKLMESKNNEVRVLDPALAAQGIKVDNTGTQPLWIEIEASGFPLKAPVANLEKIALERQWFNKDGTPWKAGPLKVGDMILVRVKATSKEPIENGMVVDHIPAGLEVENLNLSKGPEAKEFKVEGVNLEEAMNDARIKHKEYRDDRFVVAASLDKQPLVLFYMLRVVTPGKFQVPATFAEDMYRPELRAYGVAPAPVTVVDPRSASK